jgi:hypothetical protein
VFVELRRHDVIQVFHQLVIDDFIVDLVANRLLIVGEYGVLLYA